LTVINVLAVIIGYLLGSIPSAYIAGRLVKGVDIRQVGGKNMGTLNTLREIGLVAGYTVLIADIGKGALAVFIAQWLTTDITVMCAAGFAAVVGHNFPVFLKFRGGKGAATILGVMLALAPVQAGISLAIIVVIILITNNFTLSLAFGFALMPLFLWLFGKQESMIYFSLAMFLFLGIRYLPTVIKSWSDKEGRKHILIEKRYKPWQTRKK